MNLRRMFANAMARRVAYVVVAIALAWLGLGDARAQFAQCSQPSISNAECADEGTSHTQAHASAVYANTNAQGDLIRPVCFVGVENFTQASVQYIRVRYAGQGADGACNVNSRSRHFRANQTCQTRQPLINVSGRPGSDLVCANGCEHRCNASSLELTIDGEGLTVCSVPQWSATGQPCAGGDAAPPPPTVPPVDTDGDGTSDANDPAPNNPGQGGQGEDGPPEQDGDCGGEGQPECGAPGAGSGNGNTSGGGGNCQTPPSSTGDAILAQIAFQTWATRCAIEGNANAGGGTGDGTGSGSGDGDGDGVMDDLANEAAALDKSQGEADAGDAWIDGPGEIQFDSTGLGFGGSCPAPPTVNGQSIDPDGNLCMLVQIIGALVMGAAFVHAGYIVGRS